MACVWISLSVFVSLIILLAFVAYKKLPDDLEDRKRLQIFFAFFHFFHYMGLLKEYLGFGPRDLWPRMLERTDHVKTRRTEKGVQYYDTTFDTVRVRVYDLQNVSVGEEALRPAIVFFHGGGWAIGTIESYHRAVLEICHHSQCIVVSIGYSRAPEIQYPGPFNDCIKATLYCFENAEKFSIDTTRVALMGDSAGGNLAAAVCLKLRDTKSSFKPRLQVLIYPITQLIDLQLPSYGDPYQLLLSPISVAQFITHYIGFKKNDAAQLTFNEHVRRVTKKKYALLLEQFLPKEFRKGYTTYTTTEDPLLAGRFDKFITDPYISPLMADTLEAFADRWNTDLLLPVGYDAQPRNWTSDLYSSEYTHGTDLVSSGLGQSGYLYGFRFYTESTQSVSLEIWRPYYDTSYELVEYMDVEGSEQGVNEIVYLEKPIKVFSDDVIGISYREMNPIPHSYDGDCATNRYHAGFGRPYGRVGDRVTFVETSECRTYSVQAIVEEYDNPEDCELLQAVEEDTDYFLTSHDNYGSYEYDNNLNKCWRIRAPRQGDVLALQSLEFVLQQSDYCLNDAVNIYRYQFGDNSFHTRGVCTDSLETNWYWAINADIGYVHFTTDGSETNHGFLLSFRSFSADQYDEFHGGAFYYLDVSPWPWTPDYVPFHDHTTPAASSSRNEGSSTGLSGSALIAILVTPIVVFVIVVLCVIRRLKAQDRARARKVAPSPAVPKTKPNRRHSSSDPNAPKQNSRSSTTQPQRGRLPPLATRPPQSHLAPPQAPPQQYPPMPLPQQQPSVFSVPHYHNQQPFSNQSQYNNPPPYGHHGHYGQHPFGTVTAPTQYPDYAPPSYYDPAYPPDHPAMGGQQKNETADQSDGRQRKKATTVRTYTLANVARALTAPKPLKSTSTFGGEGPRVASEEERYALARARLRWQSARLPGPATYIEPREWRAQQMHSELLLRVQEERYSELQRTCEID